MFDFDKIRHQSKEYAVEENDYIVYLGRFAPEKRLDMLIDAYRLSGIPQKLLLLGHGVGEKEMRKKISRDNLQGRVIIKNFTNNSYPYIKNAKAVALASNKEGLPTILAEALVLGTPVVSTSCPTGPKEILTGELAEFLSPPGDTQALANNIRKVIEHPPMIKDEHIAKFCKDVNFCKYLALTEEAQKQAT